MESWIGELAGALGEEPLSDPETARLLDVAREVAHRVERKVTPLAAFLLGSAVGRVMAGGISREDATASVLRTLVDRLPDAPGESRPSGWE